MEKLVPMFLAQRGLLASGWNSQASHFTWPKFINILPRSNTHWLAHSLGCYMPALWCSHQPEAPLSHMDVGGLRGAQAIPWRNLLQCIVHWPRPRMKDQLSSWKGPGSEFAKFFKRAVVTGWWAMHPWRVLCSWEAAIAVFQRWSYNWTMYEDI